MTDTKKNQRPCWQLWPLRMRQACSTFEIFLICLYQTNALLRREWCIEQTLAEVYFSSPLSAKPLNYHRLLFSSYHTLTFSLDSSHDTEKITDATINQSGRKCRVSPALFSLIFVTHPVSDLDWTWRHIYPKCDDFFPRYAFTVRRLVRWPK